MALFTGPMGPFGWQFQDYQFSAAGSNKASFEFVNAAHFTTNTVAHRVTFWHIVPQTDDTEIYCNLTVDGGTGWVAGTEYATYLPTITGDALAVIADDSAGDSEFHIAGIAAASAGMDSTATTGGAAGSFIITGISQGTDVGHMWGLSQLHVAAGGVTTAQVPMGVYETVTAHNGLRLIANSGGIDGHVMLEGLVVPLETGL